MKNFGDWNTVLSAQIAAILGTPVFGTEDDDDYGWGAASKCQTGRSDGPTFGPENDDEVGAALCYGDSDGPTFGPESGADGGWCSIKAQRPPEDGTVDIAVKQIVPSFPPEDEDEDEFLQGGDFGPTFGDGDGPIFGGDFSPVKAEIRIRIRPFVPPTKCGEADAPICGKDDDEDAAIKYHVRRGREDEEDAPIRCFGEPTGPRFGDPIAPIMQRELVSC